MQIKNYSYLTLKIVIIFVVLFFSFITSNTDNPVRLSNTNAQEFNSLIPQGWAFFTRDPREEVIRLYDVKGDEFIYLNNSSSLSFNDMFGIVRKKRKLSAELAELIKKIPTKSWIKFDDDNLLKNLKSLKTTDTILNVFSIKVIPKGEKIIYRSKRKPWAWSNENVIMPYKCAKIYVK